MLQYKSFKLSDGEGISKFLKEYTLPADSSVFSNSGDILVPFDDAEPLSAAQKINLLKQKREVHANNIVMAEHGKRTHEVKVHGMKEEIKKIEDRLETSKTGDKKRDYDIQKDGKAEIKVLENMISQGEASARNEQAKITDFMIEIAVYDEEIAKLEGKEVLE